MTGGMAKAAQRRHGDGQTRAMILGFTTLAALALSGCEALRQPIIPAPTMRTVQASAETVAICYDPKARKQADTRPAAQSACAQHGRKASYAATAPCKGKDGGAGWLKVIYRCAR